MATRVKPYKPRVVETESDPVVGAVTGIVKADGSGNVSSAVEDADYQGVPAEGAFADGDKTKIDNIEAGIDITGIVDGSLFRYDQASGKMEPITGVTATPEGSVSMSNMYLASQYDAGNSGAEKTINIANGRSQKLTLTENCAITLTAPASTVSCVLDLELIQGAGGSKTATLAGVYLPGGTALSLTATEGAKDTITLVWNGTYWRGQAGLAFAVPA